MWCLDVGIPEDPNYDVFVVAGAIETQLGMAAHAGYGFGFRDMQFEFKSFLDAHHAQNVVLKVLIMHSVHHHDMNEFTGSDHKSYAELFSFPVLP
jgi:hypothetical protein